MLVVGSRATLCEWGAAAVASYRSMSFVDDFVRSWVRARWTCELAKWIRSIKKFRRKETEEEMYIACIRLEHQSKNSVHTDGVVPRVTYILFFLSFHSQSVSVVFLFMICSFSHLSAVSVYHCTIACWASWCTQTQADTLNYITDVRFVLSFSYINFYILRDALVYLLASFFLSIRSNLTPHPEGDWLCALVPKSFVFLEIFFFLSIASFVFARVWVRVFGMSIRFVEGRREMLIHIYLRL